MNIALTGATGFVGRRFVELANAAGHRVIAFTRKPERKVPGCLETRGFQLDAPLDFSGCEAVVHLAGESVVGLWTRQKRERILQSRVEGTQHVARSICAMETPPRVLVSASAIGIYGDTGDRETDETAPSGNGFLAEVAHAWETAANDVLAKGVRLVHPRIAIVYGRDGGALQPIARVFKLGLGGRLGSGRQWISWIHLDDLCALILHAIENEAVTSAINASAPNPITNADFTRTLARIVHRPAILPVPAFTLRAMLGEFSTELLASKRIVPRRARESGFTFLYPTLEAALRDLV